MSARAAKVPIEDLALMALELRGPMTGSALGAELWGGPAELRAPAAGKLLKRLEREGKAARNPDGRWRRT